MMQARVNMPYVVEDVDRHGNVRLYYRRKGKKVRLRGLPGSPEFQAAYDAARERLEGLPVTVSRPVAAGSFEAACRAYYDSRTFRDLDTSTQTWRRRALDKVCEVDGRAPIAEMLPVHVKRIRDEPESPGVGNQRLKAVKALLAWAFDTDIIARNPAREVPLRKYAKREHHSWTAGEMAQFVQVYPLGTKQHLAFVILTSTAGRREDAVRLGPQHLVEGRLRFVQAKNEHRKPVHIDIPLMPPLRAALAELPDDGRPTWLMTDFGKPFTAAGFGLRFAEWCKRAGLPDRCRAHGLRKATAAMLAQAGATSQEIMAITGHSTLEEVERYTRGAIRSLLADSASAKLDEFMGVPPSGGAPVPPAPKLLRGKG